VEAGLLEGDRDFGVAGERIPDDVCAEVFGHEGGDAEVAAQDVGVVPVGLRVERVAEAVAAAGALAVDGLEGALDAQGKSFGGVDGSVVPYAPAGSLPFLPVDCQEGQRAGGGVRDNRAVHAAEAFALRVQAPQAAGASGCAGEPRPSR
jgi:hypothetical protein